MFPIRDHNPSGRTPYVTYALMAVNIGVFLSYLSLMADERALGEFYYTYALLPARLTHGEGYFGDNVEDEMGHGRYLLFYLACGIAAGLGQVVTEPLSWVPMVGASGAIAGVMGGYLLLFPRAKVDILVIFIVFFRIFAIPAWIMLGLWFGMQFIGGIGATPGTGGVAYWAHSGGFIAGLVLALPLWLRRGGFAFWRQTDGPPPHAAAKYDLRESRIPKVGRK